MNHKKGDKVLIFTHFKGKPQWLPARVEKIMEIMENCTHIGVYVRKDYQGLIDGANYTVLPAEFVFGDIVYADKWVTSIDQGLNKFVSAYDNSAEAWIEKPTSAPESATASQIQN